MKQGVGLGAVTGVPFSRDASCSVKRVRRCEDKCPGGGGKPLRGHVSSVVVVDLGFVVCKIADVVGPKGKIFEGLW